MQGFIANYYVIYSSIETIRHTPLNADPLHAHLSSAPTYNPAPFYQTLAFSSLLHNPPHLLYPRLTNSIFSLLTFSPISVWSPAFKILRSCCRQHASTTALYRLSLAEHHGRMGCISLGVNERNFIGVNGAKRG